MGEWSRPLQVEIPILEIFTTFTLKKASASSSSYVPSKKMPLFLTFKRYPLVQYNYSEDTTSLYEM